MSYHSNYQRGQALSEYVVLIPAAIMIMVAAGLIAGVIISSFGKTIDGLAPEETTCDVDEGSGGEGGTTTVNLGNHSVELVASVYDANSDTTTLSYLVTSGPSPSISHWVLGLPAAVAANIVDSSEAREAYGNDPTTDVTGIKFDTGYEVGGGGGGGGEGGPGRGRGRADAGTTMLMSFTTQSEDIDTTSRTVTLLLTGEYEFDDATLSVKAGTDVHLGTISMPVRVKHTGTCEE